MGKINLAPDVRLEKMKTKRMNFYAAMAGIIVVGVIIVFILILQGYKWSKVFMLSQTNKKIAKTDAELKNYEDIEKMVVNIEQGLKAINSIESKEPKWSKFFPILEKVTPNDVRFTELSQDSNKFSGKVEGQSIYAIGRVIKSLEDYEYKENDKVKEGKKLFKGVEVNSYTSKDGRVSFDITFEMEGGILW